MRVGIFFGTVMLRKFAIFVLLIPMAFNGLWMVCSDGAASVPREAKATTAEPSSDIFDTASYQANDPAWDTETAAAAAACARMCPLPKQAGAICVVTSDGDGSSIAAFMFLAAPPMTGPIITASFVICESVPERAAIYSNPSLDGLTPPPRA
jgi:hypothetical protein